LEAEAVGLGGGMTKAVVADGAQSGGQDVSQIVRTNSMPERVFSFVRFWSERSFQRKVTESSVRAEMRESLMAVRAT
jgi:hypothetical protein